MEFALLRLVQIYMAYQKLLDGITRPTRMVYTTGNRKSIRLSTKEGSADILEENTPSTIINRQQPEPLAIITLLKALKEHAKLITTLVDILVQQHLHTVFGSPAHKAELVVHAQLIIYTQRIVLMKHMPITMMASYEESGKNLITEYMVALKMKVKM